MLAASKSLKHLTFYLRIPAACFLSLWSKQGLRRQGGYMRLHGINTINKEQLYRKLTLMKTALHLSNNRRPGNNDTVPLLQPEIPTVRVDDDSSYDQPTEEPEKDDSDSPREQKQEEPGKEPDDESPSAPLLQREIDVEIKPDDQKSSSAPGEENTSA